LGGKTQLAYDAQDNLTEVKDPRGVTTRYEYDGLGNLTRLVSPDSGTTTFEHDAAGNVIRRTDARGAVTEYRYDALNRLIERHSPSDPSLDVQYRYDLTADGNKGIGRLGAIEGARDSLVYRYDERGNLVEQVRSIRLDQQTLLDRVTYRYEAANQLLEIGYPSGLAIGYPRNAGGQVASVTLAVGDKAPSPLVGQIAYLPFGPLQRLTWGNGIALSREYDQDYQLLRQKVGPWQSDYQHDANGNIQQHRHSLWGTLDYQYDPLDRLTEERGVQGGRSYAYDAVGNRTQRSDNPASGGTASSQDYQYAPDSNRLTAIGAQAVTSDAAGNLTQDRAARKLAYDAQGRLQSVSLDGQQVAEYRYNALGQRIVKLTPESITTYLYGPDGQLLGEAEHDGSGRKLRAQYYLWLDSLPLATIDADYDAQGKVGNPTLLYLHGDHLDTPRLATDASGQIAWQWQSDAFGRGEALSQGSTQVNLRFPGQYYDAESGLHYNYFRDYDPETGRYVESDPIGLGGGLNTYGYVEANPVLRTDSLGLMQDIGCITPPRSTAEFWFPCKPGGGAGASASGATGLGLWCVLNGTCAANNADEECPVPGATPGEKTRGPSQVWEKPGDSNTADDDFDNLSPTDVQEIPVGRKGTLPDGRTVVVRPVSSDGRPTIEIQDGRNRIKIRYGQK
ncbi:TPA: RHS repeat domain-containing protein, partial [Pseudomonas aeruginosa]|nr:RHS repeat protein [Pseudomonas aeruginosa]HCF4622806.1 RHS repeat protein [Pseudomonas aeruginosa]